MTCCRSFFFFLFVCSLISPATVLTMPYYALLYALCRYLLPLRVVFVRKTAVISFVLFCPRNSSYLPPCGFVRAAGICSSSERMVSLWQLQPFLSFPIFLYHILQNTRRLLFFVCCFVFSLLVYFFPLFFLWSGLFCWCSRTRYAT